VRELASSAASAFGRIDVWVNNAGTSMWGRFEEIPLESQARLIELNLLGAINGCHAALPHLFERGGRGTIINVGSIFGRVPMPFAASYSASKFGLTGFTEALRSELAARSEIAVCTVHPAYVDTPTYLNSANYTGRVLRPVPPVVPRSASRSESSAWRSARAGPLASASCTPWPVRTPLHPTPSGDLRRGWADVTCSARAPRQTPPTVACSRPLQARPWRAATGVSRSGRGPDAQLLSPLSPPSPGCRRPFFRVTA
jgi:NAD(P)-dependent dehydrogenase (short-subunit alcohol dehydrogenase family)